MTRKILLIAAAFALVAAACGDDDDVVATTQAPTTAAPTTTVAATTQAPTTTAATTTQATTTTAATTTQAPTTTGAPAPSGPSPIVIAAIDFAAGTAELRNVGSADYDLSGHFLCNRPSYAPLPDETVAAGATTTVDLAGLGINAEGGELALYTSASFDDAGAIARYVEWGSAGHGRTSTAIEAGIWGEGDFVDNAGADIASSGDDPVGGGDWSTADGPTAAGGAGIVIASVDFAAGTAELRNVGSTDYDLSGHFFCNRPNYVPLPAETVAAGATMTVDLAGLGISGDGGELGLYTSASFGDAESIVRYVEWGNAGHGRTSTAIEAGVWGSGDFVDNGGANISSSSDDPVTAGDWSTN
ncbi:MAG: hypothetical protein ACE5GC_07560 [Acidimicrobiia bacterium]